MSIRVLIADDQGLVRAGLRSLIAAEHDLVVVGEAVDGQDALDKAASLLPDVILMDIRMPVLNGLAATRQVLEQQPSVRVLILTTFDLDEYVFNALRAGASGFLLKDTTAERLITAIRTVAAGEALLDPAVTRRVIETFVGGSPAPPDLKVLNRLTGREVQVLRLLAQGLSNAEIAAALVVTTATAKTHVSSVLTKLDLRDRVQGVVLAYETGLVQPSRRSTDR